MKIQMRVKSRSVVLHFLADFTVSPNAAANGPVMEAHFRLITPPNLDKEPKTFGHAINVQTDSSVRNYILF
jgi:hypothetical protein